MRSLLIILLLGLSSAPRQEPVVWIRSFGVNDFIVVEDISADQNGDLVMAGSFYDRDSLDFGALRIASAGMTYYSAFVAKLDSAGNPRWLRNAFHTPDGKVFAVATDSKQNIYVAGRFGKELIAYDTVLKKSVSFIFYAFIQKYTPEGTLQWTRELGIVRPSSHITLNITRSDELIVSAFFDDCTPLGMPGLKEYQLLKLDTNAHLVWARELAQNTHAVTAVMLGVNDNITVAGRFHDKDRACRFGASLTTVSTAGETLSRTVYPCHEINDIDIDIFGNVFVTGTTSEGGTRKQGYLARYSSGGREEWKQSFSGERDCTGMCLAVTGENIFMIAGGSDISFEGTYIPDPYRGEYLLEPTHSVLLKITKQGKLTWWNTERYANDIPELATAVDGCMIFAAGKFENLFQRQRKYTAGTLFVAKLQ